jgi:flagellar motor switch protein FliG
MNSELTRTQRAAIVLISMGPDAAVSVAERLQEPALRSIKQALDDLRHVPRHDLVNVISSFLQELEGRKGGLMGGSGRSMALLSEAIGQGAVSTLESPKIAEVHGSPWPKVAEIDADTLADFLQSQATPIAALILENLPSDKAGEVMGLLPDELALSLVSSLTEPATPSPAVLKAAESMIQFELLDKNKSGNDDPQLAFLGEVLGTLPRAKREAALGHIEAQDTDKAVKLRQAILSLEDLPDRLPSQAVQTLFRAIEKSSLLIGLQAGQKVAPESVDYLLANISQRMADNYKEEIAQLPPLTDRASDKAIASLVGSVLKLARAGEITLISQDK